MLTFNSVLPLLFKLTSKGLLLLCQMGSNLDQSIWLLFLFFLVGLRFGIVSQNGDLLSDPMDF